MAISFALRARVPDGVLVQELQGESVFLNLASERYFTLDEVGTRMWRLLTQSDSIQAAYDQLLAEYDVAAEQLRSDLGDLLDRLVQHGLIELHEPAGQ